jgi:catechol 2,3-dioxygenase-like lactoylglutathione lyase family enzyme
VAVSGLTVPLLARQARTACGYGAPVHVALFAGIRVRDVTAARAWYERLLGEPSFFPNATEVVWTLADGRSLYIEEDPGRAGGALITVFVDDLDALITEIGSRGLEPAERETYSNGVRKATYRDDDGNEVGFGGGPRND